MVREGEQPLTSLSPQLSGPHFMYTCVDNKRAHSGEPHKASLSGASSPTDLGLSHQQSLDRPSGMVIQLSTSGPRGLQPLPTDLVPSGPEVEAAWSGALGEGERPCLGPISLALVAQCDLC